MLSAGHVLSEYAEKFFEMKDDREFTFFVGLPVDDSIEPYDPQICVLARVCGLAHEIGSDVVALSVELVSSLPIRRQIGAFALTARTPRIGDPCFMAGYTSELDLVPYVQDGHRRVRFSRQLNASRGTVSKILPGGTGLVRFPCFETTAQSEHQMSGGPIIVGAHVAGLVSSGLRDESVSFGSLLGPTLGMVPALYNANRAQIWHDSLLTMAKKGQILVHDIP
jgi:hypothetical protein